jgi:polysaccharide pyruvyl transferase CsaB
LRLLISGYYGAGNLGDEALLAGLLAGLRGSPVDPLVASFDPAATAREHGVAAVHRYLGLPAAVWRCDALLSGGGGLLQDATSSRSLGYYLGVIRLARTLRRPAVVFGQSLGPLSPAGKARVRRALKHVPLALRDRPSLELANRLGLRAVGVADTALLLPRLAPADRDGDGAATLVLVPRAGYPAVGNALADLGRRHLAAGGRVRLVSLHREHDAGEMTRLRWALPAGEAREPATVAELRWALAGVHAVVSGRLHGLVLGAALGTPVAGLAYDPKVSGFAHDIGAPVVAVARSSLNASAPDAAGALQRFVDAPTLDVEAVARMSARAGEGVRWLLEEALHVGSCRGA